MAILVRANVFELTGFADAKHSQSGALLRIKTQVLSDRIWASYFGEVERWLLCRDRLSLAELRIDLRRCTWADPLPLLSLLLLSRRLIADNTDVVWLLRRSALPAETSVPNPIESIGLGTIASHIRAASPAGRLIRYLATDGYLEQALLSKIKLVVTGNDEREEISDAASLSKWIDLPDELAYANATIIPVQILEVPEFGDDARLSLVDCVSPRHSR